MRHREGRFQADDVGEIYWQSWSPDHSPRAILLLVHGLAEHSGRYTAFAEFFTAAGFGVHTFDHPGHGRSAGRKGYVRDFNQFTKILGDYVVSVKRTHPELPVYLVGHSMGGLIAAAFLIRFQSLFAGAVLSGPAIRAPEQPSRFAVFIMRIMSKLLPRLGVLQVESAGISRDPGVVQAYESDPLVFRGKVSARLAAELHLAMQKVQSEAATIHLPLLILHGGSDSLTDVGGSQLLHREVRSSDKKIIVYEGLYHEIFNEPERLAVMTDMKNWIEQRLSGSTEQD